MKKLIAILMAIAMIAALSVMACAEDVTPTGGASATVKGTYVKDELADAFKVDITWGAMTFQYKIANKEWNTETHNWDVVEGAEQGWAATNNSNTIALVNHSSKSVTATFRYTATVANTEAAFSGTTEGALTIAAPEVGAKDGVPASTTVSISGGALTAEQTNVTVGTITVSIVG